MSSDGAFIIQPARPEDVETIAEHNIKMAAETESIVLDREVVFKGVKAPFGDPSLGNYYLAIHEGQLAGQLFVNKEWVPTKNGYAYWVQSVYVRHEHRRKGCYRALYQYIRQKAIAEGAVALKLYVDQGNARARATYENLGMKPAGYVMEC